MECELKEAVEQIKENLLKALVSKHKNQMLFSKTELSNSHVHEYYTLAMLIWSFLVLFSFLVSQLITIVIIYGGEHFEKSLISIWCSMR